MKDSQLEQRKLTYKEKKEYDTIEFEIEALEREKVTIGDRFTI